MNKYLRTIIILILLSAALFGPTTDNIDLGLKITFLGVIFFCLIFIMLLSIKKCYKFVIDLPDYIFDKIEDSYKKIFKK